MWHFPVLVRGFLCSNTLRKVWLTMLRSIVCFYANLIEQLIDARGEERDNLGIGLDEPSRLSCYGSLQRTHGRNARMDVVRSCHRCLTAMQERTQTHSSCLPNRASKKTSLKQLIRNNESRPHGRGGAYAVTLLCVMPRCFVRQSEVRTFQEELEGVRFVAAIGTLFASTMSFSDERQSTNPCPSYGLLRIAPGWERLDMLQG